MEDQIANLETGQGLEFSSPVAPAPLAAAPALEASAPPAIPVAPPAPVAPSPLKRSYFGDAGGYSSFVKIDGYKIFIQELTDAQYGEYQAVENECAAEMRELKRLRDAFKAQAQSRAFNPAPAEKVDAEKLRERSEAVTEKQAALNRKLIEKAVIAWELPGPDGNRMSVSAESIARMPRSLRLDIAAKILQKSRLGADEGDEDF